MKNLIMYQPQNIEYIIATLIVIADKLV